MVHDGPGVPFKTAEAQKEVVRKGSIISTCHSAFNVRLVVDRKYVPDISQYSLLRFRSIFDKRIGFYTGKFKLFSAFLSDHFERND